jgi:hypothetical protein
MGSRIEKSFLPVFSFYRAGKGGDKSWPSHQIEHGWSFCAPQLVQIVNKLKESIKQNGLLVVCRTERKGANNATIFQSTDSKFRVLLRLGSGSEIEDLITGI